MVYVNKFCAAENPWLATEFTRFGVTVVIDTGAGGIDTGAGGAVVGAAGGIVWFDGATSVGCICTEEAAGCCATGGGGALLRPNAAEILPMTIPSD